MRIFFLLSSLAMLILAVPATGTTIDYRKRPEFQRFTRQIIEMHGVNCPVPLTNTQMGEDARRRIEKIDCQSADGSTKWSLRIINPPNGESRFEPW
ncbi:hypothetical protein [Bradyrhizobium sp. BWA-3-5]|uniref:hypothetical protein n=1 Tax=Bradyrhizobium sp. BWA-3-5 TaxID=3080013 RepID=UPI00293F2C92|nr:hypothetical protein [Bradyrhizobium sp. BWA-3-5]WOH64059.1 hypothetical protein RX331_26040 [Bradyrhizobium sp. BWA-3-5]WOH64185.1 hypothetical protein RX331_26830 [Bradyrhizobium sp. BWA-3-5]WOH70109.1 hypothetical protein RX331_37975 [Bradyrhizobium sp. BWA-3-5]